MKLLNLDSIILSNNLQYIICTFHFLGTYWKIYYTILNYNRNKYLIIYLPIECIKIWNYQVYFDKWYGRRGTVKNKNRPKIISFPLMKKILTVCLHNSCVIRSYPCINDIYIHIYRRLKLYVQKSISKFLILIIFK